MFEIYIPGKKNDSGGFWMGNSRVEGDNCDEARLKRVCCDCDSVRGFWGTFKNYEEKKQLETFYFLKLLQGFLST